MALRASCAVAVLALTGARTVFAEPSTSGALQLDVESPFGWTQGQHNDGATLGVTSRVRYGLLTGGVGLQLATIVFNSMGSASALAGVAIPFEFLRLDVLAELGINSYTAVGSNFLSEDPGADARLPFAGVRSSLLMRVFRTHRGRDIWIGPSIQYAKDLRSTTRTYTYHFQGDDWISGTYDDYWTTRSVHLGQSRVCYLMTVGVSISP